MGGRIWAESELHRGSTFHFTAKLPIAAEGAAARRLPGPVAVEDVRVLIVDDNRTNRRILQEIAANWGMRVMAVPSAQAALEILRRESALSDPVRLLLTDVNMPEVDGITLVESIRCDARLQNLAIITLTSGSRPEDLKRLESLLNGDTPSPGALGKAASGRRSPVRSRGQFLDKAMRHAIH